jgi:hypothetical protein
MADDKKKAAPPAKNNMEDLIYILVGLFLLSLVLQRVATYVGDGSVSGLRNSFFGFLIGGVWPLMKLWGMILSGLAIYGIIYATRRLNAIVKEEKAVYERELIEIPDKHEFVEKKNEKWEQVITHLNSPNPAEWRLAIIEADIILEDLLQSAGYHGAGVGEMLKSVEVSDFTTLESAWAGHKVRNKIAHSGSDFLLNEREAKEAIAHYEAVFKEFNMI